MPAPAWRGRGSRIAARVIRRFGGGRVEPGLQQVQHLGVEGPPVGLCLSGQPGVQVVRDAKRELNHATAMPPLRRFYNAMSRFRMYPTSEQAGVMLDHCAHARYVWNLAVEQHAH